ncbi:MAG: DUF86 domain-containing protein [Armatimonadota bacterium]
MRDDRARLQDILEAIERIERYAKKGRDAFQSDELIQTWMVHHILLIGEAAAQVSPELRSSHPEVPWRQIVAMRNLLVHAYFAVDLDEVWRVVERDIPRLKGQVSALLEAT